MAKPFKYCPNKSENGNVTSILPTIGKVYPNFIPDGDQIGKQNLHDPSRRREYKIETLSGSTTSQNFVLSKSKEILKHSIRLLIHYLRFWDVPVPPRFMS